MSTPNPLLPEGSLQQSKGKSNVKVMVFAILAVHAVFLGGLLMLGCKEKPKTTDTAAIDNSAVTNSPETASANPSAMPVDPSATQPGQTPAGLPALPNPSVTAPVANPGAQAPVGLTGAAPVAGPSVVNTPTAVSDPVGITPSGSATEHVIASGDTFGKIAKANHVSLKALQEANPNVNPTKLQIGQKIQVPAPSASASSTVAKADGATSSVDSAADGVYVVKAGDMLERIAKNHGTSVKAIKLANNLKTDRLKVGQKLKMPAAKATAAVDAPVAPASPLATTTITPSTTVAAATH